MKYVEIKNIKRVESVREAINSMMIIAPKLFLNKESLSFVLELNETLMQWDGVLEVILGISPEAVISDGIQLDESRKLIPLSKTLEVISQKDITTWNPENLLR